MAKVFYDHLIVIEEITAELDRHQLDPEEFDELVRLADQTLHHHVLDVILQSLPAEKHDAFLAEFHKSPHDQKLLDYLKKEVDANIEEKIKAEAAKVKKEILAEIKRAKKK